MEIIINSTPEITKDGYKFRKGFYKSSIDAENNIITRPCKEDDEFSSYYEGGLIFALKDFIYQDNCSYWFKS
jgi:hypothetical protein